MSVSMNSGLSLRIKIWRLANFEERLKCSMRRECRLMGLASDKHICFFGFVFGLQVTIKNSGGKLVNRAVSDVS